MEGDKSCFFEFHIPKCHLSPGLDRDEVAQHHQTSRNALGSPRTSADKSLTHSPGPTAYLPGCTQPHRTAPRRQLRVIPHTPHQIRHVLAVSKPLINSCCNRSWHLVTKLIQSVDLILPLDLIASLVLPQGTGAEQRALLWGKSTARARGWAVSRGCSPELRLNTGISMQPWGRGARGHNEGFAPSGQGVTGESQSRVGTVSSVVSLGSAQGPLPSHEGAITPVALSHGAEGCAGAGQCGGTACGCGSSRGVWGRELSCRKRSSWWGVRDVASMGSGSAWSRGEATMWTRRGSKCGWKHGQGMGVRPVGWVCGVRKGVSWAAGAQVRTAEGVLVSRGAGVQDGGQKWEHCQDGSNRAPVMH